jgi:hypothetical protein
MFQFINLLPNLEVLLLDFIDDENVELPPDFRLKLPKLRKLSIEFCIFEGVKIFNLLDDDTLEELSLSFIEGSPSPDEILLKNQRNIKKIAAIANDHEMLNFRQLKLEQVSLEILDGQTLELLKGQDKITYADFFSHDDNSTLNLHELKSLEVLMLQTSESEAQIDLSSNLKIRRVYINEGFASIRSAILQELLLCDYSPSTETLAEIAVNCPNLRYLAISIVNVASVLLNFPKLESLIYYQAEKFSGNIDHQHLKRFCQWNEEFDHPSDVENIIAIVDRCVNLESLEFYSTLPKESVGELLLRAPRLKAFSMFGSAQHFVEVVKEFGGNLKYFRCDADDASLIDLKRFESELNDQFDEFYVSKCGVLHAKKKGSNLKFCYSSRYHWNW